MPFQAFLEFASSTDAGLIRPQNEDSLLFDAPNGFALLADGMGGYNAGEVASALAVAAVAEGLRAGLGTGREAQQAESVMSGVALLLRREIEHANTHVFRCSMMQPELAGMGTTLVALVFCSRRAAVVAHIGDSRLYRLRGQLFEQLTHDHTVLQERVNSGEIAPELAQRMPHRGLLTRALGVEATVDTELHAVDVLPGDVFLLCSDGLPDMLEEKEIKQVLAETGSGLQAVANRLVGLANSYGGFDNVSVVLVRAR